MTVPTTISTHPEVDSFYHLRGVILEDKVCQGLGCFVARHCNENRRALAAKQAHRVYCLGKCYAGPAATGDSTEPLIEQKTDRGILLNRIVTQSGKNLSSFLEKDGFHALRLAFELSREEVIKHIETAGLRGRGGAGFPTGTKWRSAFVQSSPEKFVIANADEGDPGSYIDRILMEQDPYNLIEAMAIAGYIIGSSKGIIYLRAEYPVAQHVLQGALIEARKANLLGTNILETNFSFDIEIHVGEGSYLCGEETSLIASIEGKHPFPRSRPPFVTESGLHGKPTLIQNIETFSSIPWIIRNGGKAYHEIGFSKSRGTKLVSLSSLFNSPGLYEVEFGVPVSYIVEELGGGLKTGPIKGVLIGGPLAGIIPPHLFNTPFGFEELRSIGASVGHGGVVAFDEHTNIAELIHHVFSFGAYESCGKCVPCRLGTRQIEKVFGQILQTGKASLLNQQQWVEIIDALKQTSLCGFGTGLGEFAASVLRYYGKELQSCFR